MLKYQAASKAN